MKIGFFASGNLGYDVIRKVAELVVPEFIATDRNSESIINWANKNKIRLFSGNPRNGKLLDFLKEDKFEIGLSINYIFLLDELIISRFQFPVNFHGSLLPKYRGRTPHVWAIINNEIETGITAHLIDKGCDTGPIFKQVVIPIKFEDTGADLLTKFTNVYPVLAVEVLKIIQTGNINLIKQDETIATYFGKRTKDDGSINWQWSRERIRNWVRAQSKPYPGAFSYYENKQVTIDKVTFSSKGFHFEVPNGTIIDVLENGKPIIKTTNGCLIIDQYRESNIVFKPNSIFHD